MSTQPNPADPVVVQNRERLPPVVRHHDRVPALLEQAPGDQLVDAVVFDEKNAPGVAGFAQGVARDERRPIPFTGWPPNADRIASRRSERLIGLGRYAAMPGSRHRAASPGWPAEVSITMVAPRQSRGPA